MAAIAAGGGIITAFSLRSMTGVIVAGGLGFVALLSLGGVWTEMIDASARVYSKEKRQGVECDRCGHVNRIYPWSL